MKHRAAILLLAGTLMLPTAKLAGCIWDSETLASEHARFPEIAHLITGQFPRHSREFHEWRIVQCQKQLQRSPYEVRLYDDLAVSQHKLGDHRAAIATMLAKEERKPGVYETFSNLGTFYIYTGELDIALQHINRALAINANAHFGREKYQKWLIEWLLERQQTPPTIQQPNGPFGADNDFGFAAFVSRKIAKKDSPPRLCLDSPDQKEAIRGVTGMLRFADFDNPVLLEALGDLLSTGDLKVNASHLGALCYLRAHTVMSDAKEKERLNHLFKRAVQAAHVLTEEELSTRLETGLAKGRAYAEQIRQDELRWITGGADASAEFQRKYLASRQ